MFSSTGPYDACWEHRRQALVVEVTGKTPKGEEVHASETLKQNSNNYYFGRGGREEVKRVHSKLKAYCTEALRH